MPCIAALVSPPTCAFSYTGPSAAEQLAVYSTLHRYTGDMLVILVVCSCHVETRFTTTMLCSNQSMKSQHVLAQCHVCYERTSPKRFSCMSQHDGHQGMLATEQMQVLLPGPACLLEHWRRRLLHHTGIVTMTIVCIMTTINTGGFVSVT